MVKFLQRTSMEPQRASLVKPLRPFRSQQGETKRVDLNVSEALLVSF